MLTRHTLRHDPFFIMYIPDVIFFFFIKIDYRTLRKKCTKLSKLILMIITTIDGNSDTVRGKISSVSVIVVQEKFSSI